jgi:hypothetical protein
MSRDWIAGLPSRMQRTGDDDQETEQCASHEHNK